MRGHGTTAHAVTAGVRARGFVQRRSEHSACSGARTSESDFVEASQNKVACIVERQVGDAQKGALRGGTDPNGRPWCQRAWASRIMWTPHSPRPWRRELSVRTGVCRSWAASRKDSPPKSALASRPCGARALWGWLLASELPARFGERASGDPVGRVRTGAHNRWWRRPSPPGLLGVVVARRSRAFGGFSKPKLFATPCRSRA
mmetsp:Transcript_20217/g.61555  ORF Transcript_20217/g.61555 Transcript_20217/m.61555 type:complete len:203 (+) Transcript_20217:263-871(+)|eukprot:scaffold301866_cov26-Tisochrysis_lutea.AAC.4